MVRFEPNYSEISNPLGNRNGLYMILDFALRGQSVEVGELFVIKV